MSDDDDGVSISTLLADRYIQRFICNFQSAKMCRLSSINIYSTSLFNCNIRMDFEGLQNGTCTNEQMHVLHKLISCISCVATCHFCVYMFTLYGIMVLESVIDGVCAHGVWYAEYYAVCVCVYVYAMCAPLIFCALLWNVFLYFCCEWNLSHVVGVFPFF